MGKRKRPSSPTKENLSELQELSVSGGKSNDGLEFSSRSEAVDVHSTISEEKSDSVDKCISIVHQELEDDRPTPQLRISARVQNKQKKEENQQSASAAASSSQDEEEEEEEKTKCPEPVTERPNSRLNQTPRSKNRKRTRAVWSFEDKNAFFESINENGKDFEAIQNYLSKLRKKNNNDMVDRNKDQVRHFYYRTLHKIHKYVSLNEDIKKSTRELYTLINYGEVRRKIGGTLDERRGQKLEELIYHGVTSIRCKGKLFRIKTPICRTLKKLNGISKSDEHSVVRVPTSVCLEIVPASVEDWNRVQSLAYNPRVRISCSMQKGVSSVIEYLQDKWRSPRSKIRDSLLGSGGVNSDFGSNQPSKVLKLQPRNNASFNVVNVQPETQVTTSMVCLKSHLECLRRKREYDQLNPKKFPKPPRKKKNSISVNSDSGIEKIIEDGDKIKELDDICEELSQEEDGSDPELDEDLDDSPTHNSTSKKVSDSPEDDVQILSFSSPKSVQFCDIKSPNTPLSEKSNDEKKSYDLDVEEKDDAESFAYDQELLDAIHNIKKEEEEEPSKTIHQLIALENVASTQDVDDDADVVCIGESTRLTAQLQTNHTKEESLISQDKEKSNDGEPSDCPQLIESIKKGWSLNTASKLTVGELYLMCGKNQVVTLEYSFVDEKVEESDPCTAQEEPLATSLENVQPETSEAQDRVEVPKNTLGRVPLPSPNVLCNGAEDVGTVKTDQESSCSDMDKKKCAENISSMMSKLLYMVKILSSKNNNEVCVCGSNQGNKLPIHLRSPSSSRSLSGIFKSPSNTRSPRAGLAFKSPKTPTVPQSPGTSTQKIEKSKPSSAKCLIASTAAEKSKQISTKPQETIIEKAEDPKTLNQSKETQGTEASAGSSSEFRVPIGPAPRPLAQKNNKFNAQLSKLIPRYSRSHRRSATRKQMVVQRQLPLLPRLPASGTGMIAVRLGSLQSMTPTPMTVPLNIPVTLADTVPSAPVSIPGTSLIVQQPINVNVSQASNSPLPENSQANSNSIFVNVSGQQLLTVQMPSCPVPSTNLVPVSSQSTTPIVTQISSTPSVDPSNGIISNHNMSSGTASVCENVKNDIITFDVDSNIKISGDMPFISTPIKSDTKTDFSGILNTACETNIGELCPSENSEKSDLLGIEEFKNSSPISMLKGNLQSTPPKSYSETSLLNTPTHTNPSKMNIRDSMISPIKLNLNSFLNHEESTTLSIGISGQEIDDSAPPTEEIPELHIPEFSGNLPILDISMGGTVSVKEPVVNNHNSIPVSMSLDSGSILPGSFDDISVVPSFETVPNLSNTTAQNSNWTISTQDTNVLNPSLLVSQPSLNTGLNPSLLVSQPSLSNDINPSLLVSQPSINPSLLVSQSSLNTALNQSLLVSQPNLNTGLNPSLLVSQPSLNLINTDPACSGVATSLSFPQLIMHSSLHQPSKSEAVVSTTAVSNSLSTPQKRDRLDDSILNHFQESTDKILDFTLGNSNSNSTFSGLLAAASGNPIFEGVMTNSQIQGLQRPLLTQGASDVSAPLSPPSSPSRLLSRTETQWIQNEANEFSLSSLLGAMESPTKPSLAPNSSTPQINSLISSLNDNTVDFTATFARLKKQVKERGQE